MNKIDLSKPVIILGCPRSGTKLVAKIIGGSISNFLITEHGAKTKPIEEETKGEDELLWQKYFKFKENSIEPIYNKINVNKLRSEYLYLAGKRRLVIKNPNNIVRIKILKEMFPNAFFIFCIRNPWHTMHSIIKKSSKVFLLKTIKNNNLPNDLLLKAAYSWGEAIDVFLKEKSDNWTTIKYEDLINNTKKTVKKLFVFLSIKDETYYNEAILKPKILKHNHYPIKKLFFNNQYQSEILDKLIKGCSYFNYEISINSVEANILKHFIEIYLKKIANKIKPIIK